MKNWQGKFLFIFSGVFIASMCLFFVLKIFNENLIFFYTPSELISKKIEANGKTIKVGGFVLEGSLKQIDSNKIQFVLTDHQRNIKVFYMGIVPALFKEGQGTIATGTLKDQNTLNAKQILAKHDENYIPAEIVNNLKNKNLWKENK